MYQKLIGALFGFFVFLSSGFAWADGPYAELKLGANAPSTIKDLTQVGSFSLNFDNGFSGALAIGIATDHMRFEAEVSVTDANFRIDQGLPDSTALDGNLVTAMANVYYDLTNDFIVTPYVGLGVGYASTNLSTASDGKRAAFQAIAGFKYEIKSNFWVGGEYRHFRTGTDGDLEGFKSNSFMATFAIGF